MKLVIFTSKAAAGASRRTKKNQTPVNGQPQEAGLRNKDSFPDCNFFLEKNSSYHQLFFFFSQERPPVALGILWSWAVGGVEIEVHGKRRGGESCCFPCPPPSLSCLSCNAPMWAMPSPSHVMCVGEAGGRAGPPLFGGKEGVEIGGKQRRGGGMTFNKLNGMY